MKREATDLKDNTMKSGKSTDILEDSAVKKMLKNTTMEVTEMQERTPAELLPD